MPPADPWLKRQNAALRLRGCDVSLDLAGSRIRLRATLPPKPGEPRDTPDKQRRISTGLAYPDQAAEAVELADALGKALERHRVGAEPFDWLPWLRLGSMPGASVEELSRISGIEAVKIAREWWLRNGRHRHAAEYTWTREYEPSLKPLLAIPALEPEHLTALVETRAIRTRIRKKVGTACAAVATALGWPADVAENLRAISKGYGKRDVTPRDLPSDAEVEEGIDRLSPAWQWPAAMVATYGCRPHEALLYAEVLPSGVARIDAGKTGARQSLALPPEWIERWDLKTKRLPKLNWNKSHADIGCTMTRRFYCYKMSFGAYDLRHAWAVRAIRNPQISPSLAAKSMGHSLTMHSSVYQRWFDSNELEAVQSLLNAAS
jgi:integrase